MRGVEAKLLGFIFFKTLLLHPAARLSFLNLREYSASIPTPNSFLPTRPLREAQPCLGA